MRLVQILPVGADAAEVVWRPADGSLHSRLLFRADLDRLTLLTSGRSFAFTGEGALFQLALEALRIRLAHLFDPFLAVTTSAIEPLPHQITAVYGEMLRRQPLRFLLADDPGAGKTIMAGLLIKELMVRGDLRRCLIVAPGSLVEQWQDELDEKFGLAFEILTRDRIEGLRTGNPFDEADRWIVRLDQLSRSDELQAKLDAAHELDLVVCDEAHRMSASWFSGEARYTRRYQLGQRLGRHCRHLLLMSATPHNGKPADFELFMALLDGDRFEGRRRDGVHLADPSDLMRRLTKEELVTFAGRKLFPERRAYTVAYRLSPDEAGLYAAVTDYVREEMNRADRLAAGDGKRRQNVGFALQVLQRRLASSPAAIHESLKRRLDRLTQRLDEERARQRGDGGIDAPPAMLAIAEDDLDEVPEAEIEAVEEAVSDTATAAQTVRELQAEIATLALLERQAQALRRSGTDTKWQKLLETLGLPEMTRADGSRRKLIVFSEPRDTLFYLEQRIATVLGRAEAVAVIHGGIGREERRRVVEAFRNDPELKVLLANDAAGEGVNLQNAHLMVNYDLPWNPNRIEQRFGRIHRIGQTEVCHLWNLVAAETREGAVLTRLLEKLEAAREALGGRVFDVLGQLFEERPLRDLLVDAVRYGDDPARKQELERVIDGVVDRERLGRLLAEQALVPQHLDGAAVTAIRDEMERANAQRLQPRFVQRFFIDALARLGGTAHLREAGRWKVTNVPAVIRDRDRQIGGRDVVLPRYERIAFDKAAVAGPPRAALVCPGHPLLDAVVDLVQERHGGLLRQGAVLVAPDAERAPPRLLVGLRQRIEDGRPISGGGRRTVAERLVFVTMEEDGAVAPAGPAPHLDLRPASGEELALAAPLLDAPWLAGDVEAAAKAFALRGLIPDLLGEVRARRLAEVDKVEREVVRRLRAAIDHWDHRASQLRADERAGKDTALAARKAAERAEELAGRLEARLAELALERDIGAASPSVVAAALVVSEGWLAEARGESPSPATAEARRAVELAAMAAVMAAERAAGRFPQDVSAENRGWDIESRGDDGLCLIEVKGRAAGADTVTLTCNEVMAALNAPERWVLALIEVADGVAGPPRYVRGYPFGEASHALASLTLKLTGLLKHAKPA